MNKQPLVFLCIFLLGNCNILYGASFNLQRRNDKTKRRGDFAPSGSLKIYHWSSSPDVVAIAKEYYNDQLLHRSSLWGQTTSIPQLLANGADINTQDSEGLTALMIAAATGRLENVRILLRAGADVMIRNKASQTVQEYIEQFPFLRYYKPEIIEEITRAYPIEREIQNLMAIQLD